MGDDIGSLVTHSKSKSLKSEGHLNVAGNFRLWITTQSDVGRLIPGKVQHMSLFFSWPYIYFNSMYCNFHPIW